MGSVEVDRRKITGGSSCHVVAMPYPGRGHINAMMNLCKLLASKDGSSDDKEQSDMVITFVVTEEWLGFIGSDPTPGNIRLRSIPNVIPSENGRAGNFADFVEAVMTKMEGPFEELLDQLDTPPTAIITDTLLTWAVEVGNRRDLPVASLCTFSPAVFSVIYHLDLLVQKGHFPVDLSGVPEKRSERIGYIPGIASICLADLGSSDPNQPLIEPFLKIPTSIGKAHCLLLTSFYEVDTKATDVLRAILPCPIYCVGPSIPYMTLKDTTGGDEDYMKWLNSQSTGSVLYVSLGSFLSVSSAQMDEIAAGLHDSGVPYLWVARQDTSRLQKACGDKGLVIPWSNQLSVLCHSSIGGFWTHCGWNSILETVFAGVPILAFPIYGDQFPNSKLIAEDLGIGWRVNRRVGMEKVVKREEITRTVQCFMNSNEEENKDMRRRASELKDSCRRAIEKCGSSTTNLEAFVRDILQYRH